MITEEVREARRGRREDLVKEYLAENTHEQLYNLTSKARVPMVYSIREQWKDKRWMSDKQAKVLAGWLADEEMEFDDDE